MNSQETSVLVRQVRQAPSSLSDIIKLALPNLTDSETGFQGMCPTFDTLLRYTRNSYPSARCREG